VLGIIRISLLVFLAAVSTGASAQFKVLHSFSDTDGASPTGLIQTADGFFYGSAANGGDVNACSPDGCGTLFKSDSAGNVTVLHVFHASDGYSPTGLVPAPAAAWIHASLCQSKRLLARLTVQPVSVA